MASPEDHFKHNAAQNCPSVHAKKHTATIKGNQTGFKGFASGLSL